jgi:hypothetical protein
LFLLLTLSGLYVFFHWRGLSNAFCAALLLTFAFFTKQSALLIAAPVLGAFLLIAPRHALMTIFMLAAMVWFEIYWLDLTSDDWFSFYAFDVPAGHKLYRPAILEFWMMDVMHVGWLAAILLFMLAQWCREDWRKALAYGALTIGCLGTSYISRLHSGGYINVLMPAHAMLALAGGLGLAQYERLRQAPLLMVIGLLVLVQMAQLHYRPQSLVARPHWAEAGDAFVRTMGSIEGDVFIPELQFVQGRAGKKSFDFGMPAFDIMRSNLKDKRWVKEKLRQDLENAIRTQQFAGIVPGHFIFRQLPGLNTYYRFERDIPYPREHLTGRINFRRLKLYVPRKLSDRSTPDKDTPDDDADE